MSTNLKGRKNCKAVVDNAVKAMGGVDILVNNATYQMMVNDIKDLSVSEYVSSPASLISPFSTIRYKLVNVFKPHLPTITISPRLTFQSAEANGSTPASTWPNTRTRISLAAVLSSTTPP